MADEAGKLVLIIDDDDTYRSSLDAALRQQGFQTQTAVNGKEGVRQYREQPADLVITDLHMPEQEGLETIRILKEHSPDVRIIAISAGLTGKEVNFLNIAERFGAQAVIEKPFSLQELVATVNKALSS
jgi:DNA-binding response OmpR family regulator